MDYDKNNDVWRDLVVRMMENARAPLKSPTFILYFFVFLLGIGAVGPWVAYYRAMQDMTHVVHYFNALATFALTLAAATFSEIILPTNNKKGEDDPESNDDKDNNDDSFLVFPRTCAFIVVSSLSIIGLILNLSANLSNSGGICSLLACILSAAFWWDVNSGNGKFSLPISNVIPPEVPTGGDTDQNLHGSLEGLST